MAPLEAALLGAKEIFFAVIATTGTGCRIHAGHLPAGFDVGLIPGIRGHCRCGDLGTFVALTLTPMLSSKF